MIDGVTLPNWETITPWGLLVLLLLLFYFEKVVPIGRVRAEEKRTDKWQAVAEKKDATIADQAETIRVLAKEAGPSIVKVMGELQDKAGVDQ